MQAKITNYTKKRYIGYILISMLALVLPFIKIKGNHFFLLSFVHFKLNIFFFSFNIQELYLMPFLIMSLFLFIFFITTLAGRVWCAWSCPQTIFRVIYRDLLQTKLFKIHKNINNKQKVSKANIFKKLLALLCFYFLSVIAISNLLWYFVPPEDFFSYLNNIGDHTFLFGIVFIGSLAFTFDIAYLKEKFCVYVCPYARVQSTMFDNDTMQVIYDEERGGIIYDQSQRANSDHHKKIANPKLLECTACEACVRVCPTHIDIREGMQLDCINCLECADACSKVQAKLQRPSLINFTSINALKNKERVKYIRTRTLGYFIVLIIICVVSVFVGKTKEYMLLNINRSSQLYSINKNIKGEEELSNAYIFLFQNIDSKAHEYYFEVRAKDIIIQRPSKPFKLRAGGKVKKIVVLKAIAKKKPEYKNPRTISIRAFALDDKKISVDRQSIFVYPKN